MTPEERQLLTTLADRIKNTPPQQQDAEAAQLLQQLTRERPDTVYVLAQTVLMQDFALRSAQAQIEDLQRQLSQQQPPSPERGSGSFLGSVPRVNPWGSRPAGDYPPPPEPRYAGPGYAGPVMQPSQTSGFLRNAASTAAGVAGGALLFQGISSLFSGHHGGLGGDLSSLKPAESLSAATASGAHQDDAHFPGSDQGEDYDMDSDDYGDDGDFGGDDYA